jgi:Xaa-Pro aminopeptidase
MGKIIFTFLLLVSFVFNAQEVKVYQEIVQENYGVYDTDILTPKFHAERRQALRALMPDNSVAVFFSNPIRNRSNDVDFEYHQDPNFYYLTGISEPHAVLFVFNSSVICNGEKVSELVFVQKRDTEAEVWTGERLGTEGSEMLFEIEKAYENTVFKQLDLDFKQFNSIHYIKPQSDVRDDTYSKSDLHDLLLQFDSFIEGLGKNKIKNTEIHQWMSELREYKKEEELVLMKRAIEITCTAQKELMRALKPGMKEYQSEAIIEFTFKKNGAEYPGFPSILGSGENACVLHYVSNRKIMTGNNLLVSDVGAEYHGYTADVTRTLPVDGKYSEEEKVIYNIVLEAQQAGIDACYKGNSFWAPNVAATTVLSQKMQALGIIKSPVELRKYFMHGTSHYLGLDVHDVGRYGDLEPNQVITVEPGIYIKAGSPCDAKWWNIGVRIEDDILITEGEPVVLSGCAPRTIEEIEALMEEESYLDK